jgi:tRNA-uridine 2-sulfurtransferase
MKPAPSTHIKVVVGMSGGVDSSVAALLLKEQGYQVQGVFMKNWEDDVIGECPAEVDIADAQAVCERIGIPLHAVNFSEAYWDRVFAHFLHEYQAGRTPNPDILCNQEIKFKAFLDYALELGADYIATGHYARCTTTDGKYQLLKGLDANKDQSYFLYTLGQRPLSHALFPVGHLPKPEVRRIAEENGFINHAKKDSTGICFIGERRFKDFLNRYLPANPGAIKTVDGKTIGQHDGLMYYTLGQRQGLGIGGRQDAKESPWYVATKNLENNVLIVTQDREHPLLMSNRLTCSQVHWVSDSEPSWETIPTLQCTAKTRYRQSDQACSISRLDNQTYAVDFPEAQWAVTPGQSVVFYDGENCLGGGIIETRQSKSELQ